MLRNILIYGLIAGLVVGGIDFAMFTTMDQHDFDNGMLVGYSVMLLALSAVFVGVKQYRDHKLGGVIRFWPALGMGLAISFIAGVFYVLSWELSQVVTGGDFASTYADYVIAQARAHDESAEAIAQLSAQMAQFKLQYAQPLWRMTMTFTEIFPVGVLVSLVSAALLRRPNFLPARRPASPTLA